jgi:hypothetical protein
MVAYLPEATASNFKPAPQGVHRAVCYRLIDLGTQQREYQGQTSHARQVMVSWELADEFMEDGQPFTVSKFYTWSMNEKANLRKDLEAWRGKPFDATDLGPDGKFKPTNLIGAPCQLNIVHKPKDGGGTSVKIAGIMPMAKGQEKPTPHNATLFFSLDDYKPAQMEQLSEKIRAMITVSPEYVDAARRLMGGAPPTGAASHAGMDDDIPFAPER